MNYGGADNGSSAPQTALPSRSGGSRAATATCLSTGIFLASTPVFRIPLYWYVIFVYRYFPNVNLRTFLQNRLVFGNYLGFPAILVKSVQFSGRVIDCCKNKNLKEIYKIQKNYRCYFSFSSLFRPHSNDGNSEKNKIVWPLKLTLLNQLFYIV